MKKIIMIAVVAFCALVASAAEFNVRDFGAKGDGAAKDTFGSRTEWNCILKKGRC